MEDNNPFIKTIYRNSKGRETRRPKIEGTSDNLYPIVLQVYPNLPNNKRKEAIQFIKWLKVDFGFQSFGPLEAFLVHELSIYKIKGLEDARVQTINIVTCSINRPFIRNQSKLRIINANFITAHKIPI
jgi:hypothetical protein